MSGVSIAELRGPTLRDVSRSFYLSLAFLPKPLRDPISLAYLLARATDTIADTVQVAASDRAEMLAQLSQIVQTGGSADQLVARFAPFQQNAAERKLIESLPGALRWLAAVEEGDRRDVRAVLALITEGQRLDLIRFADSGTLHALETADELHQYTYLVAGCVGEFWTDICARKLPRFSRTSVTEMRSLGRRYGQGLQLTNILRDCGADLRAGRCYLPAEQLRAAGTEPAAIRENPAAFQTIFNKWISSAEEQLAAGFEYARAVRAMRLRMATVLPAGIGARTLTLLREAGADVLDRRIKVPRREVRSLFVRLILSGGYLK